MKQYQKNNYNGSRKREFESIKSLMDMKSYSKALAEVIRYVEKYPDDMYGHFLQGRILLKVADYENAKESFKIVSESNSKNKYQGYENLGYIAEVQMDYDLAKKYYYKVIAETPYSKKYAITQCSKIERASKNPEGALAVLEYGDPNDIEIKFEKARTYFMLGDYEKTQDIYDSIKTNNPELQRKLIFEKALLDKICGNLEIAKRNLLQLISNGDKDEIYYKTIFELSNIGNMLKEYDKVIEYCEELENNRYTYGREIYIYLGVAKQGLEKYDSAISCYSMALDSKYRDVRAVAKYYLGSLLLAKGDFTNAEKHLLSLINDENSTEKGAFFKLIGIYIKQKRFDDLESIFEKLNYLGVDLSKDKSVSIIKTILQKEKYKNVTITREMKYMEKQIVDYDTEKAIQHIYNNHRNGNNEDSQFSFDVDIRKLFDDVKNEMISDNRVNDNVLDIYEVDRPECGYANGEILNRVRVVVVPGTTDIVTMYPVNKSSQPRQSDFYDKKGKSKSLDRLSRFNARYGNKLNVNK